MARKRQARIEVQRRITVPVGPGLSRTFPAGWSGSVPVAVAAAIVSEGAGLRTDEPDGE